MTPLKTSLGADIATQPLDKSYPKRDMTAHRPAYSSTNLTA